jgi:hypothetical protein
MRKILAVFFSIALLCTSLVGCGGGGGSSSSGALGGAAVNGPLEGASIWATINGVDTQVGTTGTDGSVSITVSSLSGAEYPLYLWTQNGTIHGETAAYNGSLSTVLRSASGVNGNLYFSIVSSLVAENFKRTKADYANGESALDAAKNAANILVSNFGATFDPLTANPYTDINVVLVQKAMLKAAGIDETTAAGSALVTSQLIDGIVDDFVAGTPLNTIVSNNMPAIVTSAGGDPEQYVKDVMKTDETFLANLNTQFGGEFDSSDVNSSADALDSTTATANVIGDFEVTLITDGAAANPTIDGFAFAIGSANTGRSASEGSYTIALAVKDGSDTALNGATVTAALSDSTIGTLDVASAVTSAGAVSFTLTTAATDLTAGTEFTLTFVVTNPTDTTKTSTLVIPGAVYDSTGAQPKEVTVAVINEPTPASLFVLSDNATGNSTSTHQFDVRATIPTILGSGSIASGEYFVNFHAPDGMFFVSDRGTSSNYIVPVPAAYSGAANIDARGTNSMKLAVSGSDFADGINGQFRAEVLDADEAALAPAVSASTARTYYAVKAADTLRRLELEVNATASTFAKSATVNAASAGSQTSLKFVGKIVTWESSLGGTYSAPSGLSSYDFRISVADANGSRGFVAPDDGLNIDVKTELLATGNSTGENILDNATGNGWDYYVTKIANTDNTDRLTLEMVDPSSGADVVTKSSNGVLLVFE